MRAREQFKLSTSRAGQRKIVAASDIKRGQCIIMEAPMAAVRLGGDEVESSPISMEWRLVGSLIRSGFDDSLAKNYCCARLSDAEDADRKVFEWLKRQRSDKIISNEACKILHRTVTNNAFAMESCALGLQYGSGFYKTSSYFNHSCDPNCLSVRMGGNMAVFAVKNVKAGEELCHSYIRPELLLKNKNQRNAHLFFQCECSRCISEAANISEKLSALEFTERFKMSELGKIVGKLKILASSANDQETLREVCEQLRRRLPCDYAETHPIGALDVTSIILDSILLNALGDGEFKAKSLSKWLEIRKRASAKLMSEGMQSYHGIPEQLCAHTWATATIAKCALGGVDDADLNNALEWMKQTFGGTLDCLREDISFLAAVVGNNDKYLRKMITLVNRSIVQRHIPSNENKVQMKPTPLEVRTNINATGNPEGDVHVPEHTFKEIRDGSFAITISLPEVKSLMSSNGDDARRSWVRLYRNNILEISTPPSWDSRPSIPKYSLRFKLPKDFRKARNLCRFCRETRTLVVRLNVQG